MSISMKSMMIFLEGLLPFFLPLIGLLTPHLFGFSSHALESDPHCKGSVCVCSIPFTNIHCNEDLFFFEMNPSSFLIQNAWLHLAPVLRSVNTSSHSLTVLLIPCFSYLCFIFFSPIHLEENVHAPDSGWKLQSVFP